MENKIEVGQRFGKLVVFSCQTSQNGRNYCFCNCDCGAKGVTAYYDSLLSGKSKSCKKCELKPKNQKTDQVKKTRKPPNPLIKHPLHRVWSSMIMRCENPKRPYYHLYGGRGIKVCPEWRDRENGYMNFYNWSMENGYKFEPMEHKKPTKIIRNKWCLDRIDNNLDYSPENCRWADIKTQNENQRANMPIEYNGEVATIKEFLRKYNATVPFFYSLLRNGMTELEALNFIANL